MSRFLLRIQTPAWDLPEFLFCAPGPLRNVAVRPEDFAESQVWAGHLRTTSTRKFPFRHLWALKERVSIKVLP